MNAVPARHVALLLCLGTACLGGAFYFSNSSPVLSEFMRGHAIFFYVSMGLYIVARRYDSRTGK